MCAYNINSIFMFYNTSHTIDIMQKFASCNIHTCFKCHTAYNINSNYVVASQDKFGYRNAGNYVCALFCFYKNPIIVYIMLRLDLLENTKHFDTKNRSYRYRLQDPTQSQLTWIFKICDNQYRCLSIKYQCFCAQKVYICIIF